MATYRVGVLLTASGGSFQRGMRAAANTTRQTDSALQRASGSATAFGRRADDSGRRAQSALQRASGSVRGVESALRRTSGQACQTGDVISSAARRGRTAVRGVIQSFRELGRAARAAGADATAAASGSGSALRRAAGAAVGGYAFSRAAGQEMAFDDRYALVAKNQNLTDPEALALRRQIESTAARSDIRVGHAELLGAVEEWTGLGGELDAAMEMLEGTARFIRRTNARGRDVGRLQAQFAKLKLSPEEMEQEQIRMVQAFKQAGPLSPQEFAAHGAELTSIWSSFETGADAAHDLMVAAQMAKLATADPATGMTSLLSALAVLRDPAKLEQLSQHGIYDSGNPLSMLRSASELDMKALSPIFGQEGIKVVSAFKTQRDRLEQIMRETAEVDVDAFMADTQDLADQTSSRLQVLRDELQQRFSRAVDALGLKGAAAVAGNAQGMLLDATLWGGALYGAGRAGRRGLDTWRRWRGRGVADEPSALDRASGRARGRGGAPVGAWGGPGVVHTMRVTTLIAGSTVGGGLAGASGRRAGGGGFLRRAAGGAGSLVSRAGGALRRVPWLGVALGGAGIATAMAQGDRTGAAQQAGGVVGGLGGAAAGGAAGAAIGTLVLPGVGTAIGGWLGSFTGGWLGSELGAADVASALERAAGMDKPTRDERRAEARRRWMEAEAGAGVEADAETPSVELLSRDAARRLSRESFMARGGPVVNGGVDKSVHVDLGGVTITVQSETGDPVGIGDAAYEQIIERIREDFRRDEERLQNITLSDPDPTLML